MIPKHILGVGTMGDDLLVVSFTFVDGDRGEGEISPELRDLALDGESVADLGR